MRNFDRIRPVEGTLTLRAYDVNGAELWRETVKNMIVNSGYAMILENLAGNGLNIEKIAVGTNGTPPALTDEAIANAALFDVTTVETPGAGIVRFNFRIGYDDAVGMNIREFGLLGPGRRLFSRRTRACIEKDASTAISGTWDIHIGVDVGEVSVGDMLRFSVTVPEDVDVNTVNLTAAPLKYDKHFAFTLTTEASTVGAYARAWRRINHKWIDDAENFHLGAAPGTGHIPEQALTMSDGCGKVRRMGFSCAIQPLAGDDAFPGGFIRRSDTSIDNPYITWSELQALADFGVAPCFHQVDERKYAGDDPSAIMEGLAADDTQAFTLLNRRLKVLSQSADNRAYIEAAAISPLVAFTRSTTEGANNPIQLNTCPPLYKQLTSGGESSTNLSEKLAELAVQRASDHPYWVGAATNRVGAECVQMLEQVCALYGKDGDDSVWMASWDEVYEYITMREGLVVRKNIVGRTIVFEVAVPANRAFYFRDITLLISGIRSMEGVEVAPISDNIKGLTCAAHTARWSGVEGLMANVNFNTNAIALAEKYTAQYEASADIFDREDAEYFASLLLPSLSAPFVARIQAVAPDRLQLLSITIDNGATNTPRREVALAISKSGQPTHYRISESRDFTDAEWIPYTNDAVVFELSADNGAKTVFMQLKDAERHSGIISASITKIEPVRAILAFGWSELGAGTFYDSTLKICKVGDISNAGVVTTKQGLIHDINGDVIGVILMHDLGSGYKDANSTGDNSGIYPDEVLKRCAAGRDGGGVFYPGVVFRMFRGGKYRIKLFINRPYGSLAGWRCTLVNGQDGISYPVDSYDIVNNFSKVLSGETNIKSWAPIEIKAQNEGGTFCLTAIEIEEA